MYVFGAEKNLIELRLKVPVNNISIMSDSSSREGERETKRVHCPTTCPKQLKKIYLFKLRNEVQFHFWKTKYKANLPHQSKAISYLKNCNLQLFVSGSIMANEGM